MAKLKPKPKPKVKPPELQNISVGYNHVNFIVNKSSSSKFYIKYRAMGESEWSIAQVPDTKKLSVTLTNLLPPSTRY